MSISSPTVNEQPQLDTVTDDKFTLKDHFKRVLLVASLYFKLAGNPRPSEAELERVNRKFDLAWRPAALSFPAAVANVIWRKTDFHAMLRQCKKNEMSVASLIALAQAAIPGWMYYSGLGDDLQAVFSSFI